MLTIVLLFKSITQHRCSSCWYEGDYGSPNCVECGGYALERPCPICNGRCGRLWKRDIELVWKSICNFLEHVKL